MRARLSLVLAAALGLAACQGDETTPSAASAASPAEVQENFLTLANDASLEAPQRGRLSAIRQRRSHDDTHLARLAAGPSSLLRRGGALRMAVAPGVQVVALNERTEQRAANDISWGGRVQGMEHGWVQMVYTPEGVVGTVTLDRVQYSIEPLGNGLHAVSRIDQNGFPSEHPADMPAGAVDVPPPSSLLAGAQAPSAIGAAAVSTINVLVVYTASAASAAGTISSKIQLAVDETNQSYANSGININMVRVHTAQVTYNESGRSFSQHVNALRSTTDGIMDNVHTLRNTYAADVVVLVVNDTEACGIASSIGSTASTAFAVAHWSCITGYYSFGHEVGHLQGARHDRFVDNSSSPYPYGHGFIPAAKNWRTIMAYGNNCGNCTRIKYWSNPLKTYGGVAMGTAAYEDNARVLNLTAATVAAYR